MPLFGPLLRATSFVLNLLCNFVVPVVESVAYWFRLGCEHSASLNGSFLEGLEERRSRRKKRKGNSGNGTTTSTSEAHSPGHHEDHHHSGGRDGKKVKLLVDITVRQVGGSSQNGGEIKETSRYVIEDDHSGRGYVRKVCGELGLISRMINLPSTVVLYITSKLRQWAHDLDSLENPLCLKCDPDRVKKSPKRRIPRANYRKIIPFFPFNLLGFSNYTAFQMPVLTKSTGTGPDEPNNLNVSNISANGNGKARCKRRRHSSTETSSSDNDFSHLEISEIQEQPENDVGHDEVDSNSDESPDTATKPITSSSSSTSNNGNNPGPPGEAKSATSSANGRVTFEEGLVLSHGGIESSNTSASDMDSRRAHAGDEIHVMSAFYKELEEAANETYNSQDDPDYKPPTTSTSESSFVSGDSGASDSFLLSGTDPYANLSESNGKPEVEDGEIVNGDNNQKSPQKTKAPAEPLPLHKAGSTACEDDYKTPEEEDYPSAL